MLKEVKAGREKLFINSRLMALLTAEHDKPSLPADAKKTTGSRTNIKTRRDKDRKAK